MAMGGIRAIWPTIVMMVRREREREKEECKVVITLIIVYIEMKHTRRYRL